MKEQLDTFIEKAMRKNRSLGLALAVVENGKITQAKGYGVCALHSHQAITPQTMMMIGSVTKPLTAMLIATYVDEKKMLWQDKVQAIYPTFRVNDENLAENIKLEQLLNAASGMPNKDLFFFLNKENKIGEDLLENIATLSPTEKPNSHFLYPNHMVAAAGYITAHQFHPELTLQEAYFQQMQKKIFLPLGMKRTTFKANIALKDNNHASPHGKDYLGNIRRLQHDVEESMTYLAPSGGAWSTVEDLAHFLIAEINQGKTIEGKRLISEENSQYRREKQITVADNQDYGLCWFMESFLGEKRIYHAGRTLGFSAYASFFPEKSLGIVMLSNCVNDALLLDAIHAKWAGLALKKEDSAEETLNARLEQQEQQIAFYKAQNKNSDFLTSFEGTYQNDEIGILMLENQEKTTTLQAGKLKTRLRHFTNEEGINIFIGIDPPFTWMGLELIPLDNNSSFVLSFKEEKYVFNKIKK